MTAVDICILKADNEQLRAQNKKLKEDIEKERMVSRNLKNRLENPKKHR